MFAHDPLSRDRDEIRLIRPVKSALGTLKSNWTFLELSHISLQDTVSYAALSYTWGDTKDKVEIRVNGSAFNITRNLHTALQDIQAIGVETWLWIDAICIDQSSDAEKSLQLPRIKDIFSRAGVVYMWLGPGCVETDVAMDFVSRTGPSAQSCHIQLLEEDSARKQEVISYLMQQTSAEQIEDKQGGESKLGQFIYDLLNHEALQTRSTLTTGIRNILQRDYWHRVWVIQEVASAAKAVVMAGTRIVPLEDFDSTLTAIWFCIDSRLDLMLPDFRIPLTSGLFRINPLHVRRRLQQDATQKMVPLVDILWRTHTAPGRAIYSTTDPRDILFGLLGVVPEGQRLKEFADYNLSTAAVFTIVTHALISYGDRNLDSFQMDCCNPRSTVLGPLPSWVPDWKEIGLHGTRVYRINHRGSFHASGTKVHPVAPVNGDVGVDGMLSRFGCRVDVISEVMSPSEWTQNDAYDPSLIKDADGWFRSVATFAGLGAVLGPGEDYVWRTIMRNELDKNIHLPRQNRVSLSSATQPLCRKIMRLEKIDSEYLSPEEVDFIRNGPLYTGFGLGSQDLNDKVVESFASLWREVLGSQNRNRTLFKTEKGMLGLGHVAIESGDLVTLVWGLSSPIILRQRDRGGFYFRGDAYVDGIMQGEFLKNEVEEENFCIY